MLDLLSNILAEIIAPLLLAIFVYLLVNILRLPVIYSQRRRLFHFLGLSKEKQRFIVYLSTLFISPFGSNDFKGTSRSFQGPAIPEAELAVFQPVSDLFMSSSLEEFPNFLRGWLGNRVHWSYQRIQPEFFASPKDKESIEATSMLIIGSQYYNAAGDLYAETGNPFLKITDNTVLIQVVKGPRKGDTFQPRPNCHDDLAVIEKLIDPTHETTILLAAGHGVVGTRGAVQYLVDNWRTLLRDFENRPFALCLRFQNIAGDSDAYKKPIELARFQ